MAVNPDRRPAARGWIDPTAAGLVIAATSGAVVAIALTTRADHVGVLTAVFGLAAIVSGVLVAGAPDGPSVSAGVVVTALAAAFLGPRSAPRGAALAELSAAVMLRTRLRSVTLVNLPAGVIPAIATALTARAIASHAANSAQF